MSETTQKWRDTKRQQCLETGTAYGINECDLIRLLNDADRLEELEAKIDPLTEGAVPDLMPVVESQKQRIAELEDAYTTAIAEAAGWATKADELEAEVERLTAIEAAAKRFVDLRNEWSKEAPDEMRLPMPLDYAGSALGAAIYPVGETK